MLLKFSSPELIMILLLSFAVVRKSGKAGASRFLQVLVIALTCAPVFVAVQAYGGAAVTGVNASACSQKRVWCRARKWLRVSRISFYVILWDKQTVIFHSIKTKKKWKYDLNKYGNMIYIHRCFCTQFIKRGVYIRLQNDLNLFRLNPLCDGVFCP